MILKFTIIVRKLCYWRETREDVSHSICFENEVLSYYDSNTLTDVLPLSKRGSFSEGRIYTDIIAFMSSIQLKPKT